MRTVNITKHVTSPKGKRYCRVVFSANGRINPDWVLVDGNKERHQEGANYLDWYERGKRCRESAGKNPRKHSIESSERNRSWPAERWAWDLNVLVSACLRAIFALLAFICDFAPATTRFATVQTND